MTEEIKKTFSSVLAEVKKVGGANIGVNKMSEESPSNTIQCDGGEMDSFVFAMTKIRKIIHHLEAVSKKGSTSTEDVDKAILAIGKLAGAILRLT